MANFVRCFILLAASLLPASLLSAVVVVVLLLIMRPVLLRFGPGFEITVEKMEGRCVPDAEYAA